MNLAGLDSMVIMDLGWRHGARSFPLLAGADHDAGPRRFERLCCKRNGWKRSSEICYWIRG
jgi:hypothetical protein